MSYAKRNADISQAETAEKLETRAKFKWREKGSTTFLGNVCKKQR